MYSIMNIWGKVTALTVCHVLCMWDIEEEPHGVRCSYSYALQRSHIQCLAARLITQFYRQEEKKKKTTFSSKYIASAAYLFVITTTVRLPVCHFFTLAARVSASHHLIPPRWRRSHSPRVVTVPNPTSLQSAVAKWVIRWSHQTFSMLHTSAAAWLCFRSQSLSNCRWAV